MVDAGLRVLREVFGLQDYRPGQAEVVEAQLAGRDVLAVAPTGSGKSISYWVPAIVAGRLTPGVSPLIPALKKPVGPPALPGAGPAFIKPAQGPGGPGGSPGA